MLGDKKKSRWIISKGKRYLTNQGEFTVNCLSARMFDSKEDAQYIIDRDFSKEYKPRPILIDGMFPNCHENADFYPDRQQAPLNYLEAIANSMYPIRMKKYFVIVNIDPHGDYTLYKSHDGKGSHAYSMFEADKFKTEEEARKFIEKIKDYKSPLWVEGLKAVLKIEEVYSDMYDRTNN